uniref:Uncharacterized protein n=1 Tax=Nelumbo nucifera TaxID=4432 RepID=A0A822XRD9_NELNU|nr:TPA_asm: hypothetical protein HUJ06_023174 [Nelumbo nucifera]
MHKRKSIPLMFRLNLTRHCSLMYTILAGLQEPPPQKTVYSNIKMDINFVPAKILELCKSFPKKDENNRRIFQPENITIHLQMNPSSLKQNQAAQGHQTNARNKD